MVACTTFGLNKSTVPCEEKTASTPNQSATRRIVPRFPGSLIVSSARNRPLHAVSPEWTLLPVNFRSLLHDGTSADSIRLSSPSTSPSGLRTTARTGEGEERAEIRDMASCPISPLL